MHETKLLTLIFMAKEIISQGITHNSLAQGTFIKGEIHAEGDLRIDGKVEGNIGCKGKVVVGVKGEIFGQIQCENAEIMGCVEGDMKVNGNVSLKQSSVFHGGMITQTLDIEPGALFNGTCKMEKNKPLV